MSLEEFLLIQACIVICSMAVDMCLDKMLICFVQRRPLIVFFIVLLPFCVFVLVGLIYRLAQEFM